MAKIEEENSLEFGDKLADHVKTLFLKKSMFGLQSYMSSRAIEDMSVETMYDMLTQRWITAIRGYVWSREVKKEVIDVARYPSSWIESFKERWFPKWLKKRYPVQYSEHPITIHYNHMCPHLNIDTKRKHVVFMSLNVPFIYPEKKPFENILDQLHDMLGQCLIEGNQPKEWRFHPEYHEKLIQELSKHEPYLFDIKRILGLPFKIDPNIQDIYLVSE